MKYACQSIASFVPTSFPEGDYVLSKRYTISTDIIEIYNRTASCVEGNRWEFLAPSSITLPYKKSDFVTYEYTCAVGTTCT